jgi:hypothetical protein
MFATIFNAAGLYGLIDVSRRLVHTTFGSPDYTAPRPVANLEILITHFLHAATLKSKSQFCTWFITFASAVYKGQALKAVLEQIQHLADMPEEPALEVQSGEVNIEAECRAFMTKYPAGAVRLDTGHDMSIQASWDETRDNFSFGVDALWAFRRSPLYNHSRRILASCVAGSLLSERMYAEHKWFHKRLFEGVDEKSGPDPVDLIDEILSLTKVVFDTATRCVEERSVGPLLGRNRDAVALDVEYATLAALMPHYTNGLLEDVTSQRAEPLTNEQFVARVEKFLTSTRRLHASSRDAERAILTRRLKEAMQWDASIKEVLGRAAMRIEPYGVLLLGPTAAGKTVCSASMMRHILQINGFPHQRKYIAQIDTDSSFMDSITNSTQGVFIDDMANTRPEYAKSNELMHFIRLKNSSVVPVPKAALEDKGTVFHQCKVVIVSTNCEDLHAKKTQVEPSATMRRFDLALRVKTLPEFSRRFDETTVVGIGERQALHMLDPSQLTDGIYSLHQRFEVMTWVPFQRSASMPEDNGKWFVKRDESGRPMDNLTYPEVMRYVHAHSTAHFAAQREKLSAYQEDELAPICAEHGGVTKRYCDLCKEAAQAPGEPLAVQAGNFLDKVADFFVPPQVQAGLTRADTFDIDNSISDLSVSSADLSEPAPLHGNRWERFMRRMSEWRISGVGAPPAPPGDPGESAVEQWLERVGSWWSIATTTPEVAERPAIVGWIKAASHGRFDIEDMALTYYDYVMLAFLAVPPVVASLCAAVISAVGYGTVMATSTWLGTFTFVGVTFARNVRGWIAARVAGATLKELRTRAEAMAQASFGVLASIVAVLVLIQGARKLAGYGLSKTCAKSKNGEARKCQKRPTHLGELASVEAHEFYERGVLDGKRAAQDTAGFIVQGGVLSSEDEGSIRDPIARTNHWERREIAVWYRVEGPVRNMTEEQIFTKAEKQVFVMTIAYGSGNEVRSNCFIPATNYMVAPVHNFVSREGSWEEIKWIKLQATTEERGPVFKIKVSPRQMFRLPGDAILVQINAGGTMPDVLDLIATNRPREDFPAVEISRGLDTCETKRLRYNARPESIKCGEFKLAYHGCSYVRPEVTYKGLCGAILMASARYPQVVGFHTMGAGTRGVACTFIRSEIEDGIAALRQTGILRAPVTVQNTTQPYTPPGMEDAGVVGPLSDRSVLREVEPGTEILPLGTLTNFTQVRHKTRLGVSPVSDVIAEECGEPRKHEPPQNIGKATVEVAKLKEMAGRSPINPEDFRLAKQDQEDELEALVLATGYGEFLKPLTIDEATSGVAYSASVRAINRDTAAGWPYTGSKHRFTAPNPREGLPDAFSLTPEVRLQVEKALEQMGQGERCNFVFKGSHKDEAVKINKKKARVFEGSPLVFTVISRMLFLPVIRLYLLARHQTGSSVGIDATSRDWDELYKFLTTYNGEHAVVGDWPHFDTSHHYQEIMAVFDVWITIVERYGHYSPHELRAMWTAAEETARHYTLLRGDLAVTEGTTASGSITTVYVNNPIGEMRMKAAFYGMARERTDISSVPLWRLDESAETTGGIKIYQNTRAHMSPLLPQLHGRFLDYVRGAYYGDDFVLSVRPEILGWFNQFTLETYFMREGLGLTNAEKMPFTAATTPWSEATFLKRNFRWDEDTKCHMAPLDMNSIYKSFHVWPRKLAWCKEAHAAQLFSNALRELLQHGRSAYEARAPRLIAAAERFGARQYMLEGDVSYDTMIAGWYAKELYAGIERILDEAESN